MNYMKRVLVVFTTVLFISLMVPLQADAQWGIGASYEVRDEEPKNGFGLRIERNILQKLPIVKLGLRAHFSSFSDENSVSQNNVTYTTEINDYDFGVTALGGVSIGLLKPYVGLGLGSNTVDLEGSDLPENLDDSESKIYWNALVGAEVSAIPALKPFIEYRYSDVGEEFYNSVQDQNVPASSNSRVVFGVLLRF